MQATRLVKILPRVGRHPLRYLRRARKLLLLRCSALIGDWSCWLQAQMDINPLSAWYRSEFVKETGGFFPPECKSQRVIVELDPWDRTRRDMLVLLSRSVIVNRVHGAFAELGVYQGLTARLFHQYAPERALYLFDTFEGFTDRGASAENRSTGKTVDPRHFGDTSLATVQKVVAARNSNVHYLPGYFPESIPIWLHEERFALVHLDADLYDPIRAGLEFFYPRLEKGGYIVVHDYNAWTGTRAAVDEFMAKRAGSVVPMPDKSGSAVIVAADADAAN